MDTNTGRFTATLHRPRHGRRPRRARLLGVAIAGAFATLACLPFAAGAATVTYDGAGTLVYSADPGESLDTNVGFTTSCGADCATFSGDVAVPPGPQCAVDGSSRLVCVLTAGGLRVVGGAGGDRVTVFAADNSGFPATTPYPITLEGNAGDDILNGGSAGETMHGGDGADQVIGGGGADALYGDAGTDMLRGDGYLNGNENSEGGSDQLYGGDGDDTLTGDSVNSGARIGSDLLDGGAGTDTVDSDWFRYLPSTAGNQDPSPTVTFDGVANDGRPGENDNVVNIERIESGVPGGGAPSTYIGDDGPNTIDLLFTNGVARGAGGDDIITGSDYADTLDGGAGNDKISGGFGDDVITGGLGSDDIGGDRTAGCFYGPIFGGCTIGSGNDTIYAQDGAADNIGCGPGLDVAYVDPVDNVGGDCETIHRAAAPPGPAGPGPGTTPTPATRRAPVAHLTVPRGLRLHTIARQRVMKVRCRLAAAGTCRVTATITRRDARRIGLRIPRKAKTLTLGSAARHFTKKGAFTLNVRIPRAKARHLTRVKRLKITFTARSTAATMKARTLVVRRTVRR